MNFKEIAENYSKQKRKMMTDAVITNKNHTKNFTTYHSESLINVCRMALIIPSTNKI